MFRGEYWWGGVIVFIGFILINVMIFLLRNKPQLSYAISYSIACFLFVYKTTEYIYYQAVGLHMQFPMEISAMAYFIFSILVVFRLKKIDGFGAFLGVLAGLVYSAGWWISPTTFVLNEEHMFFKVMAVMNHHLVYTGGMLMLTNVRKYRYSSFWQYLLGLGLLIGYSWIIHLFTPYTEANGGTTPTAIQITSASVLENIMPADKIQTWHVAVYYVVVSIVLLLIVFGALFLSNKMSARRKKRGLPEDYFPEKWINTYKFSH